VSVGEAARSPGTVAVRAGADDALGSGGRDGRRPSRGRTRGLFSDTWGLLLRERERAARAR